MNKYPKQQLMRAIHAGMSVAAKGWRPYSMLMLVGDNTGWSLDWDVRELGKIARRLGIHLVNSRWRYADTPQAVFFANQFFLLHTDWLKTQHHIGFSYFHGLPGSGDRAFEEVYESLRVHHERIDRVQASHKQMLNVILQTGIDPHKVYLIPIGINLDLFPLRTSGDKERARGELGIPKSAFVIGSFQKDGVGWGEGNEPKFVKGPDVFLSVMRELRSRIPELFVLLSAPGRGYVKQGLTKIGIPFKHVYLKEYPNIHQLYQALDLYLVTSRQEGGPKAILESMASGVPIVSTRVGQAADIILHEQNGWIVEVEDPDALTHCVQFVYGLSDKDLASILVRGRATAISMSYSSQLLLWAEFMKGFVECTP